MIEKLKQQLELVKAQLAADKKKAAVLGALAVILLSVVGRLLFSSSSPNALLASAAPLPAPATPVSVTPQVQPSSSAQAEGSTPPQAKPVPAQATSPAAQMDLKSEISETPGPRHTTPDLRVCVSKMSRGLARDVFNTKAWNKFTPTALIEVESPVGDGKGRSGFWGQLRHSWSEYGREQRVALQAFNQELEQMLLQSTMTGLEPMAYISGRLVRPGDAINGFSVVQIANRQVTLVRGGMTATLAMK